MVLFKDTSQLLSVLSFQMFFSQEAEWVHDSISLKVDADISVTCFQPQGRYPISL